MFKKILLISVILSLLVTTGLGCKGGSQVAQQAFSKKVTLKYWRVFDEEDTMTDLFTAYSAIHPSVTIEYKKWRYDEYQNELLNAFAEDRGPDIFSVQSTWLGEYIPKLSAAPKSVTLPYMTTTGTIKKEQVVEFRTTRGLLVTDINTNFVDQVAYDVIWRDKKTGVDSIFGVPLAMDTLVMFYNKALLNNAGIPEAPKNWSDFQKAVKAITRFDSKNNIILAGAALGTANNVERSSDILGLVMMQNGAVMETEERSVLFNEMPQELKEVRVLPPGEEALRFYTDFASPVKEVYTWSDAMPNSLDAFVSGKVGFFFGYSYHIPLIKQRSPKLNFGVAKVPQIAGNPDVNFANYFVEVVSKKSVNQNEAWDFLKFITTTQEVTKKYLDKTKKPTALRNLVLEQTEDVDIGPFASQVLTAKSWYKGYDALATEKIFKEMIDLANKGEYKFREIINNAADKTAQTTFSRVAEE